METSANPSTPTIGHQKRGHIFNFIDGKMTKRYSSKDRTENIAMEFAVKNKMSNETIESLLIEIDRLKSTGKLFDGEILVTVIKKSCKDRRG
jgi:nitrogen regulatory protein PII